MATSWFDFLRLDGELALAFVRSANLYTDAKRSAEALIRARIALATIRRGMGDPGHYGLSVDEVRNLAAWCSQIEVALAEFGGERSTGD